MLVKYQCKTHSLLAVQGSGVWAAVANIQAGLLQLAPVLSGVTCTFNPSVYKPTHAAQPVLACFQVRRVIRKCSTSSHSVHDHLAQHAGHCELASC